MWRVEGVSASARVSYRTLEENFLGLLKET
jgi:hypothetical protein